MFTDDKRIIFIPFGGLGSIGCNCSLFSYRGSKVMVDCGVRFPDDTLPGVDHVLPDLDRLEEELTDLDAIILTHGHEDHIGAVPYLLARLQRAAPLPIMGTPFTLGLVERKLDEHNLPRGRAPLVPVGENKSVTLGAIEASWLDVPHSIPMSLMTILDTAIGKVVITGDFRLSDTRALRSEDVIERLRVLGDGGVLALFSDSTNIESKGRTRDCDALVGDLEAIIEEARGRVFVSMFSSNVHRVVALWEIAKRTGRRVAAIGRSLWTYLEVAHDVGLVPYGLGELMRAKEIESVPDDEVLVILTGSQAEERSALHRASLGEHPHLSIRDGDLVILSSRLIPGNERGIHRMVNDLARRGARVLYERIAPVHTSGHGHEEELREMLSLLRPRIFVPVHGEYIYLRRHAEMAREVGIPEVAFVDTGEPLAIGREGVTRLAPLDLTPFVVEGREVVSIDDSGAIGRLHISQHGFVVVSLLLTRRSRTLGGEVTVDLHGVPDPSGIHAERLERIGREELDILAPEVGSYEIEAVVRRIVKRYIKKHIGRRPEIHVTVIDPDEATMRRGRP